MATRPQRQCAQAGCGELVTGGGYCPRHQRPRQARDDRERPSASKRGYGAVWRRIRKAYLSAMPLCERCPRPRKATIVHHRDGDQHNNAWGNLEALCWKCHEVEHGRAK